MTEVKTTPNKRARPRKADALELRQFLANLEKVGTAPGAAELLGRNSASQFYKLKERDPEFKARWELAEDRHISVLRAEAHRRGVEGIQKPITFQGQITDTYTEYSDSLLLAMLKARDPAFRDKHSHEHSGAGGGPIELKVVVEFVSGEKEKGE